AVATAGTRCTEQTLDAAHVERGQVLHARGEWRTCASDEALRVTTLREPSDQELGLALAAAVLLAQIDLRDGTPHGWPAQAPVVRTLSFPAYRDDRPACTRRRSSCTSLRLWTRSAGTRADASSTASFRAKDNAAAGLRS